MLKAWCYRLAPLLIGGNHSSNLCPKYASKTVFSGSKCTLFPALGGGTPPSRPSPRLVASLPRSAPRRTAHSDFRTPPKNLWLRAWTRTWIVLTRTRTRTWRWWLGLGLRGDDSDSDSDLTIWTRTQHSTFLNVWYKRLHKSSSLVIRLYFHIVHLLIENSSCRGKFWPQNFWFTWNKNNHSDTSLTMNIH